jgi:hypothetical protein
LDETNNTTAMSKWKYWYTNQDFSVLPYLLLSPTTRSSARLLIEYEVDVQQALPSWGAFFKDLKENAIPRNQILSYPPQLNMIQEANDYLPSSLDMELRGRR